MKRITRFKKRTWVLLGVAAVIAAMASVGAYAYWTASGTGSGSATAAPAATNMELTATGWANIYPGAAGAKAVSVTVHNPNTYSSHVNDVFVDPAFGAAGNGITTSDVGCLSAWFSLDFSSVTLNQNLAADDGGAGGLDETTTAGFGNLTLADLPSTDQNACQSAAITIHLKSN